MGEPSGAKQSSSLEKFTKGHSGSVDEPNWAKACQDDDDLQAVIQELGHNFTVSSRVSSSSHRESKVSPRSTLRSCLTQVIIGTSRELDKGDSQLHRLLSAKRNHINELTSDIAVLQQRVKELEESNRLIQRVNKRQESALQRVFDEESKLPHILEAHRLEVRFLREKIRKYAATIQKDTEKLKEYERKILRLQENCDSMKQLTKKKKLPERDQLTKELNTVSVKYQEKQKEIEGLNKKYAMMEKNFKRVIQREVNKHKSLEKELEYLHLEHQKVLEKLKDRDRELGSLQQYRGRARSMSSRTGSSRNETISGISISSYARHSSTDGGTRHSRPFRKPKPLRIDSKKVPVSDVEQDVSVEGEITLCLDSFTEKNLKFGRRLSTASRVNSILSQDKFPKHSAESSASSTLKEVSSAEADHAAMISSPENSESTVEGIASLSAYASDVSQNPPESSRSESQYITNEDKYSLIENHPPRNRKSFCERLDSPFDGYSSSPESFSPKMPAKYSYSTLPRDYGSIISGRNTGTD